jgi:Abi-like protein
MNFAEFENIISVARMRRYLLASSNDTKKAMTLYRLNLRLSQELFTVISCLEISLRNSIDKHCVATLGFNWLENGVLLGGIFDKTQCRVTKNNIIEAISKLGRRNSHNKLVAELGFGFWRYIFAQNQFAATGRTLLKIFPAKPKSDASTQYNQTFVFNQLAQINNLRNRIAHHEPICFLQSKDEKDTTYARQHYDLVKQLFQWMSINE